MLRHARLRALAMGLRHTRAFPGRWRLHRHALSEVREVGAQMRPRNVRTKDGFVITCDLRDWIGQYVYVTGAYEEASVNLVKRLVRPGDVVVDAGANIGYYSLVFSSAVGSTGRVIAFEPMPHALEALTRNLRLNSVENVEVRPMAVSATSCVSRFYLGPRHHTSVASLRPRSDSTAIDIQCTTLDEALRGERQVRLLKIDVEGAEADVLKGATRTLQAGVPHILAEVSSPEWPEMLLGAGYEMHLVGWNGIRRVTDPREPALPSQYNAWFTREGVPRSIMPPG